jgi:uncharacterized membrane protein
MRCRSLALLAVLVTATVFAQAQPYNFTTLDYPGATMTNPNAINRTGIVVGDYFQNNSSPHGFAYYSGSFVAIDVPGATFTSPNGINSKGVIVGNFGSQSGTHGFVLQDGQFTQVDVPGSTYSDVEGINDAGILGGIYLDPSSNIHSFLRFGPNQFRTVEFPGSDYTAVNALNNKLELTGKMSPPFVSAFLFSDHQWVNFYFPDAFTTTGRGINNLTQVVGIFNPQDPFAPQQGFLRNADGTFQQIDFPGSAGGYAGGINDAGVIVGGYSDSAGNSHGYIAKPQH